MNLLDLAKFVFACGACGGGWTLLSRALDKPMHDVDGRFFFGFAGAALVAASFAIIAWGLA